MKPKPRLKFTRYIPGLLVSIIAVIFLTRFTNSEELLRSFQLFSLIDLVILILILFASLVARGMVWASLLDGVSFKDGFYIINEGYLFNNLIPRSGEIARIFITSHLTKNDAFQSAAAIFFERAIDLLIAAALFLSTLSLVLEMQWLRATALWIMGVFMILLFAFFLTAAFSPRIEGYLQGKNFKKPIIEERIKPVLFRIIHGLTTINQPRKLFPALAWIVCSWVFWVLILYYAILRISRGAPFWWAVFTEGVVALGIALPSAPANLGVYEGTIVFALSIFGIESETALGAAIILHAIQIGMTMIFGLIGIFLHDFKIGRIIEKIGMKRPPAKESRDGREI